MPSDWDNDKLIEGKLKNAYTASRDWLFGGTKGYDKEVDARRGSLAGLADSGTLGYDSTGRDLTRVQAGLAQQAQGRNLVSTENLRQALGQIYGQQQSAVASAAPANSAATARQAMIEAGRANIATAGQGANAAAQEQQAAQRQLAEVLLQRRQQEMQVALEAQQAALKASQEAKDGDSGVIGKFGGAIASGLGSLFSDRDLKKGIRKDAAAKRFESVGAYSYEYKDQRHGEGRRPGIMAQDLERAGLGHAVIDTPEGKAVHGAALATSLAAAVGELARRTKKLESRRGR